MDIVGLVGAQNVKPGPCLKLAKAYKGSSDVAGVSDVGPGLDLGMGEGAGRVGSGRWTHHFK